MLKRKVAEYLRKFHLLQFADSLLFGVERLRNSGQNRAFRTEWPDFAVPPAHLAYDAYNHTNWRNYYEMGVRHASLISDLVRENVSERKIRLFEWGCGPARVIRHLVGMQGFDLVELFGADYNEESIRWCQHHFKSVSFLKCELEPPLPSQIQECDCIYALSVFTHLSEAMHYAWIEELFSALKPDGILIFTTQGDAFRSRLQMADRVKYDSGQLVVKDQIEEGKKHFSAYHPPAFIKDKLLRDHVIVRHLEAPTSHLLEQDVWVAKRGPAETRID